jgi:hypothetical protein
MPRILCLLLCFSSFGFGQTLNRAENGASSSSPVEVLYVIDSSTLTTYNVDQETLQATAVGTTTMPTAAYSSLLTSPNGQFLYYLTNNSNGNDQKLYVYDTSATGVPAAAPVQTAKASQLSSPEVNPSGTFFYAAAVGPTNQQTQTTQFSIMRNVINPSNGALSAPVAAATYELETGSSSNDCYLALVGFNPAGTTMYDGIICSGPHGSGSLTYNERSVDLQTGALGPDEQVFAYSFYAGSGYADVQFENNLLFAYISPQNQGPNAESVEVYQTQPIESTPLVNCTTSMLAVCGDYGPGLAHPSGQYVFLTDSNGITDIGAVNVSTQEISEVNTLPFSVQKISPDGTIAYGVRSVAPANIEIAGFDAANGKVRVGGSLRLPPGYDSWYVAERH